MCSGGFVHHSGMWLSESQVSGQTLQMSRPWFSCCSSVAGTPAKPHSYHLVKENWGCSKTAFAFPVHQVPRACCHVERTHSGLRLVREAMWGAPTDTVGMGVRL